ncbi:MAG: hypothetical protein GXY03_03830 [Solirubrobacterales bacterium]|nr:hypothetical protein [Solirubrobacterales bacterium]
MTASDHMHDLVLRAMIRDDALGYPAVLDLVPSDIPDWPSIAWRHLADELHPVLVVDDRGRETLFTPAPRGYLARRLDRVRRRVPVDVTRRGERESGQGLHTLVDRRAIERLATSDGPLPAAVAR